MNTGHQYLPIQAYEKKTPCATLTKKISVLLNRMPEPRPNHRALQYHQKTTHELAR